MKKIFFPHKIIGVILFNLSVFLLIYVFAFHLENTFIAYIAYILSTYSLIIFCIWFYKACQFGNEFIKNNSRIYNFYDQHRIHITKWTLNISFCINLIYGIFKLVTGIYYRSAWFITFAIYYLLLCFIKATLATSFKKKLSKNNLIKEYQNLKTTGIILLLLDIILTGMIILIVHQNKTFIYPGNLIYIVAMYDFYLIITAFINVFKHRKNSSPNMLATKCVSLTVAMISMISLEVAMIYQFGANDNNFKLTMVLITGIAVTLINSFMAIMMIFNAHKNLKTKLSSK